MASDTEPRSEIAGSLIKTPETRRDSQEAVLKALDQACIIFDELKQLDPKDLTQEQRLAMLGVENARRLSIDNPNSPKNTYTVSFENPLELGQTITQEEGIPVEDLLKLVKVKADSFPKGSKERRDWLKVGRIIYRNSKRYSELHSMEAAGYIGRIRKEANLIAGDENRRTGNMAADYLKGEDIIIGQQRQVDNPTEGTVKDNYSAPKNRNYAWYRSTRALNRRLELVIPPMIAGGGGEPIITEPIPVPAPTPEPIVNPGPNPEPPPQPEPIITEPIPVPAPTPEPIVNPGPNPEPPPQPEPQPRKTLDQIREDIVFVNASAYIRKKARDIAEEHVRSELKKESWWKIWHWPRKVGLRATEEYQKMVLTYRLTRAMRENDFNLLDNQAVKQAAQQAMDLFKNGEAKKTVEMVQEEAQEGITTSGINTEFATKALKQQITEDIIKPIIKGDIVSSEQVQAKLTKFIHDNMTNQQIERIFGVDATRFGNEADYFATTILESAQNLKNDLEANGYALDQIDQVVGNIQLSTASWGAETEEDYNRLDKAMVWIEKSRLTGWGWLLNPATVGAAFSLGTFFSTKALGFGSRTAHIATPIAGVLSGGIFAALRRNQEIKADIAMDRRQRTSGQVTNPVDEKRRKALENFQYNIASVDNLINGGGTRRTGVDSQSLADLLSTDLTTETNQDNVIRRIAEIQARQNFSELQKVDLIRFSNEKIQAGRMELSSAKVKAITALATKMSRDEINSKIQASVGEWNRLFIQNKEQQDKAFRAYRLGMSMRVNLRGPNKGVQVQVGEVWKAGVKGGLAGLAGGLISQEGLAIAARHFPSLSEIPVVGSVFKPGQTNLEKRLNWAGTKLGHPEFDATSAGIEGFQSQYQSGQVLEAGKMLITTNTTNHTVGFVDEATGNMLPTEKPIFEEPDGKLIYSGDISHLPSQIQDFLKNLPVAETGSHSLKQQLTDAVSSGHHEVIQTGNAQITVDGNHITVSNPDGIKVEGSLVNSGLNLNGDQKDLMAINHDLSAQGFNVQNVLDSSTTSPSDLDQIKELLSAGKGSITEGNLQVSVNGNNLVVLDLQSGETFTGYSDGNGPIQFSGDQAKLQHLQSILSQAHWTAPQIEDHTTTDLSIADKVHEIFSSGKHATFTQGPFQLDVDGNKDQINVTNLSSDEHFSAFFNPDNNQITVDSTNNPNLDLKQLHSVLAASGFSNIQETAVPGHTESVDVLKHFKEAGDLEHANRILWHDNGTPMHLNAQGVMVGADGKELQFYHHALSDGSVDLDVSKMVSQLTPKGGINWDSTIDSQYNRIANDIITNPDGSHTYHNFEFLFTPNNAADNAREVIKLAIGPDGHLKLPPGSDLRQFFQTDSTGNLVLQNGQPVQIGRFIEVAHIEHDASGNMTGRTILSTSVGRGVDTISVTTPGQENLVAGLPTTEVTHHNFSLLTTPSADPKITHNYSVFVIPPVAHEFTPSSIETSPIIPTPFIPRYPLEGLQQPPLPPQPPKPPYGGYGGQYGYGVDNRLDLERANIAPEVISDVTTPASQVLTTTPRIVASPDNPSIQTIGPSTPTRAATSTTLENSSPALPSTPEPASTVPQENLEQLNLFLAEEISSPVAPRDRAESIKRAKEFTKGEEVEDAASAGGLDQQMAIKLFKAILVWLKNNSLVELEKDDSTLNAEDLTILHDLSVLFYGVDDLDITRWTNILSKFSRDNGIFDFHKGDKEKNFYALVVLYSKVKDLELV